ncbi:MAG: hypothetical protein JXB00_05255 [Bacteroidales bacterium]|nr:hypothetical protein [Bacteroidales bacterium]
MPRKKDWPWKFDYMMKDIKIGICGANINEKNIKIKSLGYESGCLLEESLKYSENTIFNKPEQVIHISNQQEEKPRIIYHSENLNALDICIFREISGNISRQQQGLMLRKIIRICG